MRRTIEPRRHHLSTDAVHHDRSQWCPDLHAVFANDSDVVQLGAAQSIHVTVATPQLHFVWLGQTFPYHARLAIESATVAMPDSPIDVHLVGAWPHGEDFERVARLPAVTVRPVSIGSTFETSPGGADAYADLFDRLLATSPAACSNLVRLGVLHQHGGVYLDTDTIVVKPVHDPAVCGTFIGAEQVWALNRRRVEGRLGLLDRARVVSWAAAWFGGRLDARLAGGRLHWSERTERRKLWRLQVNNAVIGAPPGSAFIADCLRRALRIDHSFRFALGPSLLDDVVGERPHGAQVIAQRRRPFRVRPERLELPTF